MQEHWTESLVRRLEEENPWYHRTHTRPRMHRHLPGVNVAGYFRDESGWGAAGRGYVRALRALGVPYSLLDLSDLSSNRSSDRSEADFDSEHAHDINLVCVDAGQHHA